MTSTLALTSSSGTLYKALRAPMMSLIAGTTECGWVARYSARGRHAGARLRVQLLEPRRVGRKHGQPMGVHVVLMTDQTAVPVMG